MPIEELKKATRIDEERIQKLKELFPEAFAEGKLNLSILNEEILGGIDEDTDQNLEEFFGLQWNGKREARRLSFLPSSGTLKSIDEDGINVEKTNNLIIEGDNLEVLRSLQKSYYKKVKLIYIDPPYNTGSDFLYKDDFKDTVDKYLQKSGQADEGGLLTSNPKSGGRFHANWLNMLYPRLRLARNLLKEDGAIIVSIDDNELANLRLILDEIFGEENFIATVIWQRKVSPSNDAQYFSSDHEYIVIYARSKAHYKLRRLERSEKQNLYYTNPDNDSRGGWNSVAYTCNKTKTERPNLYYGITNPHTGEVIYPKETAVWGFSREVHEKHLKDNRIYWGIDGKSKSPRFKKFLFEAGRVVPRSIQPYTEVGHTQEATKELANLLPNSGFLYPKPTRLIKRLIELVVEPDKDEIVMDFFAGSGTTGQAVLELNNEDNGNRSFILVQVPEKTPVATYRTITEVTKERMRKVIEQIKEKNGLIENSDLGFAVYKLEKSYFRKWENYEVDNIDQLESNLDILMNTPFTNNWTPKDIMIELILNQGFPLNSSIKEIRGETRNTIWIAQHVSIPFSLIACFEEKIEKETVEYLILRSENSVLVCLDEALTNEAKVILSEKMKVKTI